MFYYDFNVITSFKQDAFWREVPPVDKRVPVAVQIRTDTRGETTPLAIEWPDGRVFNIVRVENRKRVADRSTGEVGWRYDVVLSLSTRDETRQLYKFGPIWYVFKRSIF